jgi:hypothetical protein
MFQENTRKMWKSVKLLAQATLITMTLSLAGCGDTDPDLDDGPDFSNSDLQIFAVAEDASEDGISRAELRFNWVATEGADFYRLLVNPDGKSGYTFVGAISAEEFANRESFANALFRFRVAVHLFDWEDAIFLLEACFGEQGNAECQAVGQQTVRNLSPALITRLTTPPVPVNPFATSFGVSTAISEDGLFAAVGANTASELECAEDEIVDVEEPVSGDCERQVPPNCAEFAEGEEPENCIDYATCEADGSPDQEFPAECELLVAPAFRTVLAAGLVYVYNRASMDDPWTLDAVVAAPNAEEEDNFGWQVSLSDDGSVLAVSAPGEDSSLAGGQDDNSLESTGGVYVFEREDATGEWLFDQLIKLGSQEEEEVFGWSLELSGDGLTLAAGSVQRDDCRGRVATFGRVEGGGWDLLSALVAPARQENDLFGESVSLDYSGSTLAVGMSQNPSEVLLRGCTAPASLEETGPGAVFVYERSGAGWSQTARLAASNAEKGDRFGISVSLNGNKAGDGIATRLLVGAPLESSDAVGVNGDQGNEDLSVASGAAYLFEKTAVGQWNQTQYLKASNTGPTDQFGIAVSLADSGTALAVGAWAEAGFGSGINPTGVFDPAPGAGAAYVFREDASPGLWSETAYVKAPFIATFASFGWTLEVAEEGEALIVGAPAFLVGGQGNAFIY